MAVIDSAPAPAPAPARTQAGPAHPLRAALGLAAVTLLGFGLAYTLLAVGLGGALFPQAAGGSLVERDGRVVGSTLVAQPFAGAGWFQPRPSAAGYDVMALAGSNQARTHPELRAYIRAGIAEVAAREGVPAGAVPGERVTRSGSAIDPHLSPDGARLQVARVARARGLASQAVQALVDAHTQAPQLGLFGAPRVNVLALNLALDAHAPPPPRAAGDTARARP